MVTPPNMRLPRPRSAGGELVGGRGRSNSRIAMNRQSTYPPVRAVELADRLEANDVSLHRLRDKPQHRQGRRQYREPGSERNHRETARAGVETAHGRSTSLPAGNEISNPGCPLILLVDKRIPRSQERRHKLLNPRLRHQVAVLRSRTSGAMKETPRSVQPGSVAHAEFVVRPHGAWARGVLLSGRNSALQPCRGRPLRGPQPRLCETAGWILS